MPTTANPRKPKVLDNSQSPRIGFLKQEEIDKAKAGLGRACGIIWFDQSSRETKDTVGQLIGLFQNKDGQAYYLVEEDTITFIPRADILWAHGKGLQIDGNGRLSCPISSGAGIRDCEIITEARGMSPLTLYQAVCKLVHERYGLLPIEHLTDDHNSRLSKADLPASDLLDDLRRLSVKLKGGDEIAVIVRTSGPELLAKAIELSEGSPFVNITSINGIKSTLPLNKIEDCYLGKK